MHPVTICRNLFLALSALIATNGQSAPWQIKAESTEGKLAVRARAPGQTAWVELATYVMQTNSRPYLHPVRDPSGKVVLTEDKPADHPWQHGIFTGFHRVNGFNYWKEDQGKQRFVRLFDLKEASDRVSWRALVELVAPDGNIVLEEENAITIHAPESSDAYVIDFDLLLRAKDHEVRFGKFFVGGLAVRMPWDKDNPRQTHLNSNGLRDRQCEQQRAAWCNVERPFGNAIFGVAMFDHPMNPNHPPGWRADEQGLINPNVSALADWTLAANQSQLFRYRLLVYHGSAARDQLTERFERFGDHEPYFPPPESQGGWRKLETPDEIRRVAQMDPDKLSALKQWLLDSDKRDFAAVAIRHGHIVLEVERGNSAKTDSRRVASVSKAICATALAIASEQSQRGLTPKKMRFNDTAFDFIPWARPLSDPRRARITVKQLLNHTSGICPEGTGARNDGSWEYILGHSGDERTAKLAFDPGTACGYSTHALAHAALVCETVTGMPYDRFAIQALFEPIGVEHWSFEFFDGGEKYGRHPSHGIGMPARDLARIAYCMLQGGRWKDQQVIPKWFVDETAAPTHDVKTPEMRWKLNPQIFSHGWELPSRLTGEGGRSGSGIPADARAKPGSGGQYIAFVPSLDLVITRQTGSSGDWQFEEYLRRACAAVIPPKAAKKDAAVSPLGPRTERFTKIETLSVGEFSMDLCRREDGAFGLGEIRRDTLPLRRVDFLITWQVEGKFPEFERRDGLAIQLRNPSAKLTFAPETRDCAGTRLAGLRMRFQGERGPIVETSSWELGGSSRGLSYFDGYRGWHAPPTWLRADAVPPTNPKLTPSLLAGTGFQFEHGPEGALLHFHTNPGDRLSNASRGDALEFETTFHGSSTVERFIFVAAGDSRLNLWTRAFEVAHAELRRVFNLPEPAREIFLQWPPFSRKGFRETAEQCAAATAREGFTGASINVIWDNADFHGGAKNMNVWDYTICEDYGGEAGLKALMHECRTRNLHVIAWLPAGHLWGQSPVWKAHPEWVLLNARGEKFVNPAGGIWHGALDSGFHDYWRDRVVDVVRQFGVDGLWLDTHLSYAQQLRPPDHGARLAAIYRDFTKAGVKHLLVEGDASAFGSYSISIGDDWAEESDKIPDPDLYYGAMLAAGSMNPRFYLKHFRRYVAAGAPWILDWDFLYSQKLKGTDLEAGRREVRQVVQDYRRVKDRMVHRFAHEDGSGYTWTNDRDTTKVVWLLRDASLPNGRHGEASQVYVIE